jgi:carotenoid cleavage dioxygenase
MLASLLRNGLTFGTLEVQKDTCNTALAVSGDRVLALMEQSPPSEVEFTKQGAMRTVSSMERLGGAVPYAPINGGSLGAHGRTDSGTGDRIHVSYTSSEKPYVRVDTFGDGWKLKSSRGVDVPTPVMVHDCALTENFVVILDFPLTIRPARMIADKFPVEFEPENGSRIGLVPRSNSGDTIWIDVENGVVLHAANAYEREDGTVVVHAFKSIPDGDSSYILEYCPAFLYEWVLDIKARRVVEERCLNPDVLVEFPNVEDGLIGKECRHTFGLVTTSIGGPMTQYSTPQSAVLLDAVVKFALDDDDEAGIKAGDVAGRFDLPPGWHFVSEPRVVTKTEGGGQYVLLIATYVPPVDSSNADPVALASDGCSMKSQVLVIDGDDMSKPVFVADLPYHVNYGLHSEYLHWDIMK